MIVVIVLFIMANSLTSRVFIWFCVDLLLVVAAVLAIKEECKGKRCRGPVGHYNDLGCTPEYDENDECCAVQYNCDNVKNKPKNKCYVNGNEYQPGESMKQEDKNPCDGDCICTLGNDNIAFFQCKAVQCSVFPFLNDTCYPVKDPLGCCTIRTDCVAKPEDIPRCEVDRQTYVSGALFATEDKPDLTCTCGGAEGQTNEPYCKKTNRPFGSDVNAAYYLHKNCTPAYTRDIDRWINRKDYMACGDDYGYQVLHYDNYDVNSVNKQCVFNNTILHLNDEVHQATYWGHLCLKCLCEVPPLPTCGLKPKSECNLPASYWDGFYQTDD